MKTIVLFTSNTGFTKQYANWLVNDLSCPWIDLSKKKRVDLDEYDTIVFGSWLMAGKIKKGKQLKSLLKQYQEKNWIVFCVGRTPLDQIDFKSLIHQNFEEDLPSSVSFFYLPGGFDIDRQPAFYKWLLTRFKKMLSKKENKTKEELQIEEMLSCSIDLSDPKYLLPILMQIKEEILPVKF
ncbi:flavodoxin domain-containing protein [Dubosiella newyorkensis]|uniref:flavodoxin domain-containing protein n=2 Tax=Dubosiella newyorkensis TaxID=1862672 RepID=UPI00257325D3|nr:flavodoxin domain-containing protein [Dubosiella newyorkensis]